jgi:hypothetical protein
VGKLCKFALSSMPREVGSLLCPACLHVRRNRCPTSSCHPSCAVTPPCSSSSIHTVSATCSSTLMIYPSITRYLRWDPKLSIMLDLTSLQLIDIPCVVEKSREFEKKQQIPCGAIFARSSTECLNGESLSPSWLSGRFDQGKLIYYSC